MHIQMNVAVVLEGPCPGEGEGEGVMRRDNTGAVENSCVARGCMGCIAGIFPDHYISRFDSQPPRLKGVSLMLFNDHYSMNDGVPL